VCSSDLPIVRRSDCLLLPMVSRKRKCSVMELYCTSIITISVPVLRVFVSFEGCVVEGGGVLKVRAVGLGRSSVL
jgi:hypothetical protein